MAEDTENRIYLVIGGRQKGSKGKIALMDEHGHLNGLEFAQRWTLGQMDKVDEIVEHLNEDNPRYEFKSIMIMGDFCAYSPNKKPSSNHKTSRARRC